MIKNAIIHVENTVNLLEFASYLHSAGWNILSANKTEEILLSEKIPVIHEPGLTLNSGYVNENLQLIRRILSAKFPDEYISVEDENENNVYIVCMNVAPKIEDFYAPANNMKKNDLDTFHLSSILRSSFSNFHNILILTDPEDYKEAIVQLRTDNILPDFRIYLAAKALNLIAAYDAGISVSILEKSKYSDYFFNYFIKPYKKFMALSHGANEHQQGYVYKSLAISGALNGFSKLEGKKMSYNLVLDISYAWERVCTLYEFLKNQYTVKTTNSDGYDFVTQFTPLTGTVFTIAVKFNSIVGAALSTNVLDSFKKTYTYDVESVSNVVLACSAVIDDVSAREIVKGNFAAVVAPSFTIEAKQILSQNQNINLISSAKVESSVIDGKLINGGILLQQREQSLFTHWNIRTKNRPSQLKTDQMALGMLLAMGAGSHSAVILKNNSIIGIAQKCVSVDKALQIVLDDAKTRLEKFKGDGLFSSAENYENREQNEDCVGDVLICDSVIDFSQPIKNLIDNGIKAIIQTGGTSADNEFINYCDERGIVMVFTGMRHISF